MKGSSIPSPPCACIAKSARGSCLVSEFLSRHRTLRPPLLSQRASESAAEPHGNLAQNVDRHSKCVRRADFSTPEVESVVWSARSAKDMQASSEVHAQLSFCGWRSKSQLQSKEQHEASLTMGQEGKARDARCELGLIRIATKFDHISDIPHAHISKRA